MQQPISIITLGIGNLPRSRRFYAEGFGWVPVFENEEIIFYQMNGLVLGTFEKSALENDMNRYGLSSRGAFSLAHNVPTQADVEHVIEQLVNAGGQIIRPADAPPHGGFRGYVADPDDHASRRPVSAPRLASYYHTGSRAAHRQKRKGRDMAVAKRLGHFGGIHFDERRIAVRQVQSYPAITHRSVAPFITDALNQLASHNNVPYRRLRPYQWVADQISWRASVNRRICHRRLYPLHQW